MFSGKSEELIRRLRRAEIAGQRALIVKPQIDDRYDIGHVVSHGGAKMRAVARATRWPSRCTRSCRPKHAHSREGERKPLLHLFLECRQCDRGLRVEHLTACVVKGGPEACRPSDAGLFDREQSPT